MCDRHITRGCQVLSTRRRSVAALVLRNRRVGGRGVTSHADFLRRRVGVAQSPNRYRLLFSKTTVNRRRASDGYPIDYNIIGPLRIYY